MYHRQQHLFVEFICTEQLAARFRVMLVIGRQRLREIRLLLGDTPVRAEEWSTEIAGLRGWECVMQQRSNQTLTPTLLGERGPSRFSHGTAPRAHTHR